MEQLPIYNLATGEYMPTLDREVCSLIYYIDTSVFQAVDIQDDCIVGAEIYEVLSVEEAVKHYLAERGQYFSCKPYSHFFVLHDELCDVYVLGNNFLEYCHLRYEEDYEHDINIHFWLFRVRYHRNMLMAAIDRFMVMQLAECSHVVEFSRIDVDNAPPIDTILGHQVIGYDTIE